MTKTSLFVSALVALFLGASAEPCPLLRAPESANKTGCYIIVLKDETSPEKFNEVLQLAVSYADGQEVYAVVENVIKAITIKLSVYSLAVVRSEKINTPV